MNKTELAIQLFQENNFLEAETLAIEIYKEDNNSVDAIDILSAIFLKTKHLEFLSAAKQTHLDLIRKIASFLENLKMYEFAITFYEKAVELEPHDIIGLNNLGLVYENLEDLQKAENAYKKSFSFRGNYPAAYNLGVMYRKLKDTGKSEFYLKKAFAMQSDNPYANYSLGMTYLMDKNFKKGYPYFVKRPVQNANNLKNFWTGGKKEGKTILVFCEYGLGDAIMFSRYLPKLKEYFSEIIVLCKQSLISIFQNSFANIIFTNNIADIKYDYSVLSMDLPYYLGLDFDNIPFSSGYLKADEEKILKYKEKYFNNDNLKIGLCYIGGELQKRNAKYRAIPLTLLEKLFQLPKLKFYSFQKDDVFNQLIKYPQIINLGETFNDFSDTAAAMKNLDIMISIDSAPVHLAGALGVKTFLMLPYYSEWRWFKDEKYTPWYESIKLFRQCEPCNWIDVIENIYNELKNC